MDSLTSLAHTTNSRHQLHQQEGEDEFDEIVPMQLDQPPPARPPPPPVVAERSVSFFTADSSNGGQGQPTSIGQQQMQSFFPNCARPPAASSIPPQQQQQHLLQPLLPHHQQQSQQFPHHPQQQQQSYPQQFGHHSPLGSRGHQMVEQHFGHPQQQQQPHGMNGGHPSFGGQQPPAFGHQQQHRGWPPPQQQHHQQHHQQQQHWQMPPMRKESMPALHFNDQPFHPTNLGGGTQEPNDINSHHDSHHHRLLEQQRTERTRSYSTAMLFCCTPSPSSMQFPHAPGNHHFHHSPGTTAATMAAGGGGAEQQDYRRTKSTVLPPTSVPGWCPSSKNSTSGDFGAGGGAGGNGAAIVHSLRRFHSQLRSPCRSLLGTAATPGILPPLKPYTPPPILSPMRQGSGLFNRILTQRERKQSSLAFENNINSGNTLLDEDRRMIIKEEEGTNNCAAGVAGGMAEEMAADDEAEGNTNHQNHLHNGTTNGTPNGGGHIDDGFDHEANGADLSPTERPQRKNGTILFAADGASGSGLSLAAELEQLRKQSSASYRSHKASMFGGGRMSILHGKLSVANDDFLRKISSISMDEQEEGGGGGGAGVGGAAEKPPESDSIPHINLGKNYQARVKKWADRAISTEERAAIPDRDEQVFCAHSVEHIPQPALSAYETLACSVALPKPGRNKELALHILAENQGNLQAAVMDLLRCDTLDWEQYQSVYNSRYVDVDAWSPEEISSFQDAIYKSEKDFQQVASELGNRTVHECVAFYYTWKKACPDDYRKLRNLRRKRQLLEQQLDMNSFDRLQPTQSEKSKEGGPSSEEDDEEEEDFSETESDITNPSLLSGSLHPQPMECSPGQQRKHSMPAPQLDPLGALLGPAAAAAQQVQGQQQMFNGNANTGYPWLHGTDGIFPSPSSSSTSTNNNDNNGSGGGGLFAGALALDGHGSEGGENGHHNGGQPFVTKIRHHHGHGHHAHGAGAKKGAQPQADGFFHCRLCEKRFEKVKSLNAHMKSHAMKARAEAEAQQKHQHNNHSSNNNNHQSHHQPTHQQNQQQQLIFPVPTKKQPVDDANPLTALTTPLGMPGLGNAQAAMAALSSLGRQIQQQQQQQGQAGQAAFAAANSAGFGLLRNMLQYGHQHAAAATAAPGTAGTQSGAGWPPGLEQHFNA